MLETWKPIPSVGGRYEASSEGRIRSLVGRRPRILTAIACKASRGYLRAKIAGAVRPVHVLVAEAWLGPRPAGLDVCHNNGVKADCRPSNLRYDTRKANIHDSIAHGTFALGERVPSHKLTADAVRDIRRRAGRESDYRLAEEYGVSRTLIRRVVARVAWPHVA